MRIRSVVVIGLLVPFLFAPGTGFAEIQSTTQYTLDLRKPKEAAKKAKWSDPGQIKATVEGLGWGDLKDKGWRDVWLQTEPIGLGFSWRPTSETSIKATVEGAGADGQFYARYSD